jgi:hypothetical protein
MTYKLRRRIFMKKVMILLAAMILVLSVTAAWAIPTINIDDSSEGDPGVTFSADFPVINILGRQISPVTATDTEFANITATLIGNFLTPGVFGAVMLENPADPDFAISSADGVSDFAILAVSPTAAGSQLINLTFVSDGAFNITIPGFGTFAAFDAAVDAYLLGVNTGGIDEVFNQIETQQSMTLFDYSGLQVNALSPAAVPVPPSAVLLGTGLLGLIPVWRLRRKA